jgi:hypothetical protein
MDTIPINEHELIAKHIKIRAGVTITIPSEILEVLIDLGYEWPVISSGLKDVIADYLVTLEQIHKEKDE